MAHTVDIKLLLNGPRNVMIHVFLKSDGATGELVSHTLIDPVEDLGMLPKERLRLARVEYNFSGFDAVLEFASGLVTPNFKWVMTEGANAPVDMLDWGLILDDSGMDGSGKLQISTVGFTNSNDMGSMLIRAIK